jgi:hypothetical protein
MFFGREGAKCSLLLHTGRNASVMRVMMLVRRGNVVREHLDVIEVVLHGTD